MIRVRKESWGVSIWDGRTQIGACRNGWFSCVLCAFIAHLADMATKRMWRNHGIAIVPAWLLENA